MPTKPTTTSFALLGLLAIKPWTAYEIVAQIRRGMHYFWPRSEAHLYAELKRLVERGHASSEVVEGSQRQATCYTITSTGRAALEAWLGSEPASPVLEVEAFVRMFFGDQGSPEDLIQSLETTARQSRELHAKGRALVEDALETGGPFPNRLHLIEPMSTFFDGFYRLLIDWCEQTTRQIEQWPSTRDVGLTSQGREHWEQLRARPDP